MKATEHGRLVIISGPSGAGKTTVVRRLMETCGLPLVLSVSATTRPPRPGERDGVDYHFLTAEDFARRREAGDFLESFEVYGRGYWYGTLRQEVTTSLALGKWVVLEIDVQGMRAVQRQFPDSITIFVRPESLEELERRLRGRGTESEETLRRRLDVARREWQSAREYQHDVVNQSVASAAEEICQRLRSHGT